MIDSYVQTETEPLVIKPNKLDSPTQLVHNKSLAEILKENSTLSELPDPDEDLLMLEEKQVTVNEINHKLRSPQHENIYDKDLFSIENLPGVQ